MLTNTENRKISIRNYYQEILQTSNLSVRLFNTPACTLVYLERTAKIQ